MLENRVTRHVPTVCEETRGLVDRHAAEVARLFARDAIRLILVITAGPLPREVDLRYRRYGRQYDQRAHSCHDGAIETLHDSTHVHYLTCAFEVVLCKCSFRSGRHDTS
jgi:hypothetical protein